MTDTLETDNATEQPFDLAKLCERRDRAQQKGEKWRLSAADLLTAYAAGERNFCDANLGKAVLDHAELNGVALFRAYLREASFIDSWLLDADLRETDLQGADFKGADLTRVNLEYANLFCARLNNASLRAANLWDANVYRADLTGVDLKGAALTGVNLFSTCSLKNTFGVYSAYAPGMSSREDYLCAGFDYQYALRFEAGCYFGSIDQMRARIYDQKEGSEQTRYLAAVDFIAACYDLDVAQGQFVRLLALPDEPGGGVSDASS